MKWVFSWLGGVLCGLLLGVALLYLNPLASRHAAVIDATTTLHFDLGSELLALSHAEQNYYQLVPATTPELWEATIAKSAAGLITLRDRSGQVAALASRLITLSNELDLFTRGLLTDSQWLITVPGRGSYALQTQENIWPLLRETVVDVGLFGLGWPETRQFVLTAGPDGRAGRVIGMSGEFAGASGTVTELISLAGVNELDDLRQPVVSTLLINMANEDGPILHAPTPAILASDF